MARPRSEEKRQALLDAAVEVFAERGLSDAPTSSIARAARVSEGTLFIYFPNKKKLLGDLYRALKLELAAAVMQGFPEGKPLPVRLGHVWERYVRWGVEHPRRRVVMHQLESSGLLSAATLAAGGAPFAVMGEMEREALRDRLLADVPVELIQALLQSFAESTCALIERRGSRPATATRLRKQAFALLWKAISR